MDTLDRVDEGDEDGNGGERQHVRRDRAAARHELTDAARRPRSADQVGVERGRVQRQTIDHTRRRAWIDQANA